MSSRSKRNNWIHQQCVAIVSINHNTATLIGHVQTAPKDSRHAETGAILNPYAGSAHQSAPVPSLPTRRLAPANHSGDIIPEAAEVDPQRAPREPFRSGREASEKRTREPWLREQFRVRRAADAAQAPAARQRPRSCVDRSSRVNSR